MIRFRHYIAAFIFINIGFIMVTTASPSRFYAFDRGELLRIAFIFAGRWHSAMSRRDARRFIFS